MRDARTILSAKATQLEICYRAGETASAAARTANVCRPTAVRYYDRFKTQNVPRIEKHRARSPLPGAPEYFGPDWIGKPAENKTAKNGAAGRGNF